MGSQSAFGLLGAYRLEYLKKGAIPVIRVGIIGCGHNGKAHFNNVRKIEGAEVTALYDAVPAAAEAWLDELNEGERRPVIAKSVEDLLPHVDAVWVTSPPALHYEHSLAALQAGKHVMCEKPIALSLVHADELVRVARENNLKYFVGYCLRFQPIFSHFADLAKSERIGRLTSLWCTRITNRTSSVGTWRDDIAMCGGMLIETFTHNIDWMRMVAGEAKEVYMKATRVRPHVNFEDHAIGVIEFENGAIGDFFSSWASPQSRYEWGIIGSEGMASRHDQKHILYTPANGEKELLPVETVSQLYVEDNAFIQAIQNDLPVPVPPEDAVKTLEVHVALKLSAREGRPISLPLLDRSIDIPSFALDVRQSA